MHVIIFSVQTFTGDTDIIVVLCVHHGIDPMKICLKQLFIANTVHKPFPYIMFRPVYGFS